MLKQSMLGTEALEYIREELAAGMLLAAYLRELKLENGHVTTYLPQTVREQDILAFRGIIDVHRDQTKPQLLQVIHQYVSISDNHYAIFENAFAEPHESRFSNSSYSVFYLGSEVYHFITKEICTFESISEALKNASAYPFIGILTSLPSTMSPVEHQQNVMEDLLQVFVQRTETLIVGAYDGVGELYWSIAR